MDLTETSAIQDTDLPVAAFRAHLRLGTGFADEATNDPLLLQYLRAAIHTIEGRISKALLSRGFKLTLPGWRWSDAQSLPIAPISAITAVVMRDVAGTPSTVDPARYQLRQDRHRPQICATGVVLPMVPTKGAAEVSFIAGFGATWDAVPDDLRQAVLLLAAHYYEARTGAEASEPPALEPLLSRWKPVRLSLGGACA